MGKNDLFGGYTVAGVTSQDIQTPAEKVFGPLKYTKNTKPEEVRLDV